MAKQIRLLATYPNPGGGYFSPGSIITVADADAAQLVQNQNATYDLTGGTPAFQPAPGANLSPINNLPQPQTISAGQTATVLVPAGSGLSMQGGAGVTGTRQVLNPDGSVVSTDALIVGLDSTGVYLRDTPVKFSVTFGTLDVKPAITAGGGGGGTTDGLTQSQLAATTLKVTSDVPLETTGDLAISNIAAGEDETMDWRKTVDAGLSLLTVAPIQTPAGPMPNSTVVLGVPGKVGDYIRRINFVVRDPANAAVYLEEGNAPDVVTGTGGTALAAAGVALSLTAGVAFTATQNQYADAVLWVTYIPTNGGQAIKFMRRIVSHAAVANATAFAPSVTHNLPAGAAITGWGIRPKSAAWEIRAATQSGTPMELGSQCTKEGGYRLSVDAGVFAMPGGQF